MFHATFNSISAISWSSVLFGGGRGGGGGEPEYLEKTTDLSQVIDKPYDTMLYRLHLTTSGIQTHNSSEDKH